MDLKLTGLRVAGLKVVRPGPFSTFQDLGRRGRGHQGVARSGAFDQHSHRLANRLVGNDLEAATIEILLGPCELGSTGDVIVSITGSDVSALVGRYVTPDVNTRGGYPVIGVIPQSGLDSLAQRRPGQQVRLNIRQGNR